MRAALVACALGLALPASAAEVVLRWAPVDGAISYDVQVAEDRQFTLLLVNESVATAGYRWAGGLQKHLYWRVRSVDAEKRPSVWSPTRVIRPHLSVPTPESPTPGRAIIYSHDPLELDLSFTSAPGATGYLVEISETSRFEKPVTLEATTNQVRVRLPSTGRLYWRVTALGPEGNRSETSEPCELRVTVGKPGTLTSARKAPWVWNANDPTVELEWAHPLDLVRQWRVEIAHGKEIISRETVRETHATLEVPGPGAFAVRVAGLDRAGRPGVWSAWTNLTVEPPPPATEPPPPLETEPPTPPARTRSKPVRAQVEPATITLVADGSATADVAVSFYDGDSRIVHELPVHVSCTDGAVEIVEAEEGRFRVRYRAPANVPSSGGSDIAVSMGEVEARARVDLTRPPRRWRVAAHLGWITNAGLISSPYVAGAASWRAPWLDERLAITAQVGYYRIGTTTANIPVTGHFIPIAATASYDLMLDPVRVYVGLGGGVVLSTSGPSYDIDAEVSPIGLMTLGVAYPLGPGELDLAVTSGLSFANQRGITGRVSGLLATLGYVYSLPW